MFYFIMPVFVPCHFSYHVFITLSHPSDYFYSRHITEWERHRRRVEILRLVTNKVLNVMVALLVYQLQTVRLSDLFVCLLVWLYSWLLGCLVVLFVVWLFVWLYSWLFSCVVGCLILQLVVWLISLLFGCFVGCLVVQFVVWLYSWLFSFVGGCLVG